MSNSDDEKSSYEALGLPPDAALDQVKARYRELNDAYLRILQSSKSSAKAGKPSGPAVPDNNAPQSKPHLEESPKQGSAPQKTHTEPIARIKERFAKGEIQKAQFEKLAKERYNYLKNKPFSDLSDSEYEERIHGFDKLKFL